ncbi:ABC transporter permease [Haloglycomyces albus]|uniref:ABC transporter permease n=1 Tax=Haloglycomyces albus TaxID=526067 RepID=UPI00046D7AC9|nr:ABC transporter permease [Haloglycomyces albus]
MSSLTTINESEAITTKERSQLQMVIKRFFRHKLAVGSLIVFVLICAYAFIGPLIWQYDHRPNLGVESRLAPSPEHPFGTDKTGKDMFGAVMKATQISLFISFVAAVGTSILGGLVGAVAGYFRGRVDAILMRFVDMLFVIPFIIIVGAVAGSVRGGASWWVMATIITLFGWLGTARAVRAEVLSLREKEFIEAAKAVGASDWKIIIRHLVPNAMSIILVSATLQIAFAILAESSLSYLGLGVQPPDTSLGLLIDQAGGTAFGSEAYLFYIPGAFIILIALTINFIGDGLRDAMDPRQTMVRR